MAETGTVLSDGVWVALGSFLAVLASGVAAWVTMRVERQRRKDDQERAAEDHLARAHEREDERQLWADERQDRAEEREDREQARLQEAGRRWDEPRHRLYADFLDAAQKLAGEVNVRLRKKQRPDDQLEADRAHYEELWRRANLLMSEEARTAAQNYYAEVMSGYALMTPVALDQITNPERDVGDWGANVVTWAHVARSYLRVELGLEDEPLLISEAPATPQFDSTGEAAEPSAPPAP